MSCLLCCTLLICIPIYMATENLILSLILSFGIFGIVCLIFGKTATDAVEKKETDYYESLNLHPTREIHCTASNYDVYSVNILHDERKLVIVNKTAKYFSEIKFQDILRCDVQQDNSTIMESSSGNAMAGAILFGATGAIIGAASKNSKDICNNLSIRIITKDILNPTVVIPLIQNNLIQNNINRQSTTYRNLIQFADEVYSTIVAIIYDNQQSQLTAFSSRNDILTNQQESVALQSAFYSDPKVPNQVSQHRGENQIEPFQALPSQSTQTPFYGQLHNGLSSNDAFIPDLSAQAPINNRGSYPMKKTPTFRWNSSENTSSNQNNHQ